MIHRHHRPGRRRGIILLVVLALLTLFAVAGVAFVFYAQSRADSARVYRESQLNSLSSGPDTPPELLFDDWIRQFIYDVGNYVSGGTPPNSAMRGHSLARTMYGANAGNGGPQGMGGGTTVPFAGTGRIHTPAAGIAAGGDDYNFVNYLNFSGDTRVPEQWGGTGNLSVPYTYPDLNNMFLAAVKADGTLICPSFHRPWLFNPSNQLNDVSNPNWTAAGGKYMILRPRPNDGNTGLPYPTDATGDVKNLLGAPGGNDSIWMDIGSAIKTLPDGRQYKPLYAALVIDLDGKINLNVAGNVRGAGSSSMSNMGMGPWEMNINYILSQGGNEWTGIFNGGNGQTGRYGANGQPDVNTTFGNSGVNLNSSTTGNHFYTFYDYDGTNETAGYTNTTAFSIPSGAGWGFPTFANQGYGNGSAAELTNHPQLFCVFQPGGDDTVFSISNMKALLYDGPTGNDAASSTLGKLCPNNFQGSGNTQARIRHLVTTLSWDLDVPALMPWVYDTSYNYTLTGAGTATPAAFPTGAAIAFPGAGVATAAAGNQGTEFGPNGAAWSSNFNGSTLLPRIDLNRTLTDYPVVGVDGCIPAGSNAQYIQAVQARQQLASDIYIRLVFATGACNQFTGPGGMGTAPSSQQQYDALRYLAQLAVNIVDYIDNDDYMTPFNWIAATGTTANMAGAASSYDSSTNNGTNGWVFGVEMPRLVINEAYSEIDNDTSNTNGDNMTGSKGFNLNFWVEMMNTFKQDATLSSSGNAQLMMRPQSGGNAYAAYQLAITTQNSSLRDSRNSFGAPDTGSTTLLTVADWTSDSGANPAPPGQASTDAVAAGTGNYTINNSGSPGSNTVYYVAGPGSNTKNATTNTGPGLPLTNPVKLQTNAPSSTQFTDSYLSKTYNSGMSYYISNTDYNGAGSATKPKHGGGPYKYDMLLRRLACPAMPPSNTPGATYNPYITVDYLQGVQANDQVTKNTIPPAVTVTNYTPAARNTLSSTGKQQPFASGTTPAQWANQAGGTGPNNTFLASNSNAAPALWLTHLDRKLVSPIELLQVCGFKPHELPQQFISSNQVDGTYSNNYYQHRAPWTNASSRLYRALEWLETKSRVPGVQLGGRVPGKININTIWDQETFQALCDAQGSNSNAFSGADVNTIYSNMMNTRTPNWSMSPAATSGNDKPFMSLAAAYDSGTSQYQAGDGRSGSGGGMSINNTLLQQPTANGPYLFEGNTTASSPGNAHPYVRSLLLNKIYNNTTTRSNTFAVWLTVGFFQVTNSSATPPSLGAEINQSTGTNIRHHMFAIVDRSTLGITSGTAGAAGTNAIGAFGTGTVNLAGPPPNWLVAGAVIGIDTPGGANQETVVVKSVSGNSFTASFNKTHSAGFGIYQVTPGNPGPQPNFSAKDSAANLPYYNIID